MKTRPKLFEEKKAPYRQNKFVSGKPPENFTDQTSSIIDLKFNGYPELHTADVKI